MLKYATIVNEQTKKCDVALGNYVPEGFEQMEVEQAYNCCWYLSGYAPEETVEEKNEKIRRQRQSRYIEESDPIRLDYDEALARGEESAEALKEEWLASKDKIREELPYIIGQNES